MGTGGGVVLALDLAHPPQDCGRIELLERQGGAQEQPRLGDGERWFFFPHWRRTRARK